MRKPDPSFSTSPFARPSVLAALIGMYGLASITLAANPEETRFFEERVRPVLATKCFRCHGEEKQKGGLRLDSPDMLLAGGDSGPAIEPGQPEKSLLVEAINYGSYEMPPDEKLPPEEIAALTAWIKMGAPWPSHGGASGTTRGTSGKISDEDRAYWAFQPIRPSDPPEGFGAGWSDNPIDRFIAQRLTAEGLSPSRPADRAALLRRLSFDLTGLPPAPEEIAEFTADDSPRAYDLVVERLLASPRYGERWARHWLDLVRFAESDGFKQDAFRPHAWRYRDYVIRAFNDDKPYDQFVREQLAGDELAPDNLDALAATSYLRHWIYEYNQRDVRTQWSNILNDMTDVTAEVFLGVSVGCARCHDHKFDPILRKDYYRLQAFFAPLLPRDDLPFAEPETVREHQERMAEWERRTAEVRAKMADLEKTVRTNAAAAAINKFPPDIRPMLSKPHEERGPFEHQIAEMAFRQVTEEYAKLDFAAKLKGEQQEEWQALRKQLGEFDRLKPAALDPAFTVTDVGPVAPATYIPGDRTRQEIQPGFLSVLDPGELQVDPISTRSTGRRTALAQWITHPENPLTARVLVNRVWQYHFGQGIVATTSDFGRLGDTPSHPELLDFLSKWFVDNGWSLKNLHRLIVTSAAYRQSADSTAAAADAGQMKDPENRWLWHMPIRRLDAEQIRDAALTVSGELELVAGGLSVDTSQPRRAIYTKVMRNVRDPLLDVFDAPDNFNSTSRRNVTTTPTQSLLMINGPWMLDRAEALAHHLARFDRDEERIERAFWLAFGRPPTAGQRESVTHFLNQKSPSGEPSPGSPGFAPFPGRGQALEVSTEGGLVPVVATGSPIRAESEFTIEAVVLLRSMYHDAAVRTIASQWDSIDQHPGWSLGVTSKKSKHDPLNLILQFVGETKEGRVYEVVASNLRLELNKPYYVAARVRLSDTSDQGVVFTVRELSVAGAPAKTTAIPHKVLQFGSDLPPLVIGGRIGNERHRWDGLVDQVRLTAAALPDEQLVADREASADRLLGWWLFETDTGVLHDSSDRKNDLTALPIPRPTKPKFPAALVDFCHVLLNASEFLYVE